MALADTARLITSLELQDKFTRTADKFNAAVGGMERQTSTLGRIGGEVGRGLHSTAQNIGRVGLVGGAALGLAVRNGLEQLQLLESAQAQTNAVLESTQGISGQTGESIRALAEKYESLNATIDDKVIQSGENLLLTFTNINKEGFEPALQAALDMNQAMGGGEEGLQGTIIQVGKALQDPIRGLTALRRVGVNFTEAQKKQIKALVEANDLYGAQQIILEELAVEFGGSFAAAGDTAAAKFAKLKDAVEDAQASLATALLPVLTKVADKLGTLLQDPMVIAKIEKFGEGLADGFDKALGFAERLPWDSIGSAFKLMGDGAKAAIDIFASAPPWLQTAILTGWGLNKLTGGALGNIVGTLGSGLIKGILGMNAGVVNINAGVVNGVGGVPVAGGGAGIITRFLGLASAVTLGAFIGEAIGKEYFYNPTVGPTVENEKGIFDTFVENAGLNAEELVAGLVAVNQGLDDLRGDNIIDNVIRGVLARDEIAELERQAAVLQGLLDTAIASKSTQHLTQVEAAAMHAAFNENVSEQKTAAVTLERILGSISELPGPVRQLALKEFTTNVNVNVDTQISVSNVVQRMLSYTTAYGSGPGGPVNLY